MSQTINPAAHRALCLRAQRAAEAVLASRRTDKPTRELARRMDAAAEKVFTAAGAAPDVARFYANCITCDVLERARRLERAALN